MKVVLTGGPSGGKTTMALALTRAYPGQVVMIPEAASILFGGGFRRTDFAEGIRHQQRAIYRVQVEHEAIYELENPNRILICDRGTLDGRAYWPEGSEDFFKSVGTTKEAELKRYDWVIHLDTAEGSAYDQSNALRTEAPHVANHLNSKVKAAWEGHPQRVIIPSTESFVHKIEMAFDQIQRILASTRSN